jgi:hypothetical protein
MKERHWTNLVSSLRYGQCILVLGPEVSAPPTYAETLKDRLTKELEEDGRSVTADSLAGVAQQYEDAEGFGPSTLRSQVATFYASTPFEPSLLHSKLAALPFPFIVSTCHDRVLPSALAKLGKKPSVYRYDLRGDRRDNPEFVVSGSANDPVVYQLFGDFKDPHSLVISENDLLDFLIAVISDRPPLPNSLRRILQRTGISLLFVGFGIRHWYLRVLLKALIRSLSLGRSGNNVALEPLLHDLPDLDRQKIVLFYQRGTRIEISDEDINAFLGELQGRLQAEGGVVMDQTYPIGSVPRVFVSYAREDNSLAGRLFSSLQKAGFEPWLDKDALRGGEDWNLMIESQLKDTDYVLILETPALSKKRVGYVNKEIAVAREQAQHYRGSFLIPLFTEELSDDDKIEELSGYQQMPLRADQFDNDVATLISTLRRDFLRRQR